MNACDSFCPDEPLDHSAEIGSGSLTLADFCRILSHDDDTTKLEAEYECNELMTYDTSAQRSLDTDSESSSRTAPCSNQPNVKHVGNDCLVSVQCDHNCFGNKWLSYSEGNQEVSFMGLPVLANSSKLIADQANEDEADGWLKNLLKEVVENDNSYERNICESSADLVKSKVMPNKHDGLCGKHSGSCNNSLSCSNTLDHFRPRNQASVTMISEGKNPEENKKLALKKIPESACDLADCIKFCSTRTLPSLTVQASACLDHSYVKLSHSPVRASSSEPQLLSDCKQIKSTLINLSVARRFDRQNHSTLGGSLNNGDCKHKFQETERIVDHQKLSAQVNQNLCNHDAVLNQLPLDEVACPFLCSSTIEDCEGIVPDVGECHHPTDRDLSDLGLNRNAPGELECAMWETELESMDVNRYNVQSNAIRRGVLLQDVLLDSSNSPRTSSSRPYDQSSDRSDVCDAEHFEIDRGFAGIDNLSPDLLLLPEHELGFELDVLNVESSAHVDESIVHSERDKSRRISGFDEKVEDGSTSPVYVSASCEVESSAINISVELQDKNNHEDEAAVECALGLVSLAQSHNAFSKTIECARCDNEYVIVEQGECHSFIETSPSSSTPINVFSSLTSDALMSDSNNNACNFERSDSCVQNYSESSTKCECKVSSVAELDAAGLALELEPSARTHRSTFEFTPLTVSISRVVQLLNELLHSYNEPPAICDAVTGFISEQRCLPPLKARPSFLEPHFESSQPSQFKNLPKLIPKPGFCLSASVTNFCLDSFFKNVSTEQLLANDVGNDALPVSTKEGAMLQNFQLDGASMNSSHEQFLANKCVEPVNSGLPVFHLLSGQIYGSVKEALPKAVVSK